MKRLFLGIIFAAMVWACESHAIEPDQEPAAASDEVHDLPEYVRRLERDFKELTAKESQKTQAALAEADRLLRKDAQQPGTWAAYRDAIKLIHRHRSLAAIPMLLKLLADDRLRHDNYRKDIFKAFTMLTGRPIRSGTPQNVAERWWFPYREEMTVDLAKMSDSEISVIFRELLDIVVWNEPYGMKRSPPLSTYAVESILRGGYRFYADSYRPLLHERLRSMLLEMADDPKQRWLVIGPLAAMFRVGRADELPSLLKDSDASSAKRVIAAAAMYRAREPLPSETLAELLRTAPALDLRQAIVWLLGRSGDAVAVETMVGCLHAGEPELREIAARSLANHPTSAAIEPLVENIRQNWKAEEDASVYIRALGSIKEHQAAATLADMLDDAVQNQPESDRVGELLRAFEYASGQSFRDAGDADSQRAHRAVKWWYDRQ